MLTLLIVLIVLALILPLLGVTLDPQIMRIAGVLLLVALVVWLVTGSGLVLR